MAKKEHDDTKSKEKGNIKKGTKPKNANLGQKKNGKRKSHSSTQKEKERISNTKPWKKTNQTEQKQVSVENQFESAA